MISPISNAHANDVHQVEKASAPKPAPKPGPPAQAHQTVKSGELSHDQVTLKSAGDVDHDGDNR